MDDLFVVYRYLTNNRHATEQQNPYNTAYRALDSYLDIEREIAFSANQIRANGGLQWSDAKRLTDRFLAGFETGILNHHDSPLLAARSFMVKYLSSEDIGSLILFCQKEQARIKGEEDEASTDESEM